MIESAVIPAAGLGSRMLPLTRSVPKEMLPVGRKPMIQHLVEEARASGLKRICIVIRQGKEIIRDYFSLRSTDYQRDASLDELEKLVADCELTFVDQKQPRGIGDALLEAREFVGDAPFLMMVPDQLMRAEVPASLQLIRRWRQGSGILSSLLRLPKADVPFFAGARGVEFERAEGDDGEFTISRLRSEEETRAAYNNSTTELRGFGRTVYPPEIFDYLGADFVNPLTGEVDLWKTFQACAGKIAHRGIVLEGVAMDLGTFEGYYHYLPRFWEASP